MMPLDETNIRPALMAYADGELDGERSAAVLDYLVAHPHWLPVVRDDQRLRATARRVMRERTPTVPTAVRDRVAALAAEATSSIDSSSLSIAPMPFPRTPKRRPAWPPVAAAAAIALGVGLLAGKLLPSRDPSQFGTATYRMPVELVSAVTRVHVDCSRFPFVKHSGPFPTTGPADGLADQVRRAFHTENSHPDLSAAGFDFVGAGPCRQPLDGTIHLLYRAKDSERRETLSVFVQADRRQIDLPARQMGVLTPADSPHPSYVWRSEGAVFFLVTDASDVADKARDILQLAMVQGPVR